MPHSVEGLKRVLAAGFINIAKVAACPHCGRVMRKGGLAKHAPVCTKQKPCPECGKTVRIGYTFCSRLCSSVATGKRRRKKASQNSCVSCGNATGNARYCSKDCEAVHKKRKNDGLAFSNTPNFTAIRRIVLVDQAGCCADCGNHEWLCNPIPLQLDHKNGNADDWRRENLRLLCPNCHALTPTFGAKNKGNGRYLRRLADPSLVGKARC